MAQICALPARTARAACWMANGSAAGASSAQCYSLGALRSPLRRRICADMELQLNAHSLAAAEAATSGLASLPLPLAHRIFLALPVVARGRASCVCRGWRDILADPALWTRLDLRLASATQLQGAARRAQGQLVALSTGTAQFDLTPDEVLPVLTANSGSLRELRVGWLRADLNFYLLQLPGVLRAAPHLQVLDVRSMVCSGEEAPRVLRAEAPLRVQRLLAQFVHPHTLAARADNVVPFAAALADATAHPALSEVVVEGADVQQLAVMDALVDAVIARPRLHKFEIGDVCTPPAPAPLARLLRNGTLPSLSFDSLQRRHLYVQAPLFDAAGAMVVADALRSNTTLTALSFRRSGLLRDVAASATLLSALVGHPSLTALDICTDFTPDLDALGAALAALVAADAPALLKLRLEDIGLDDNTFAPLVHALAGNRHLRELDISRNRLSAAFLRVKLLPAAQCANEHRMFTVTGSKWLVADFAIAANRRGD